MIHVDVFYVEDEGYYYVPIYTVDVIKGELPDKAVVAQKLHSEWKVMDDKDFLFSMYPNDLLYIESRKGMKLKTKKGSSKQEEIVRKAGLYYFKKLNIATNALFIITHDNSYEQPSLGGKTLSCLKKYTVDTLGNYSEVSPPEKRKPLRNFAIFC